MNEVRPAVAWFAERMEAKLQANDHKPGWTLLDLQEAFHLLMGEVEELRQEVTPPACACGGKYQNVCGCWRPDPERVAMEAADVANYAMILAEIAQGARFGPRGQDDPWQRVDAESREFAHRLHKRLARFKAAMLMKPGGGSGQDGR